MKMNNNKDINKSTLMDSKKKKSIMFLGCITKTQVQIIYSATLLSFALLTLTTISSKDLKSSLLGLNKYLFLNQDLEEDQEEEEEEEEDLLNSKNLFRILFILCKILSQSALFSSLLSLIGTFTSRSILQLPLKIQALTNLLITSFSSVVLGTLYLSPNLFNSVSHQLCLFAIPSTNSNSSRPPNDYSISTYLPFSLSQSMNAFWITDVSGEDCQERVSSTLLPTLILITLFNLIHLHLIFVLFDSNSSDLDSSLLLPLHHSTPPDSSSHQIEDEKIVIVH